MWDAEVVSSAQRRSGKKLSSAIRNWTLFATRKCTPFGIQVALWDWGGAAGFCNSPLRRFSRLSMPPVELSELLLASSELAEIVGVFPHDRIHGLLTPT